jgi:branched-chain amino acid transport system substrate-binding protein
MKRFVSLFAIALVLVVAVIGCQQAPKEVKIAILSPMSGKVPTFGLSTQEGALQAVDEWNANGGVLNMKIVATVEDSQCDATAATNAANKVVKQDKIHYIVGEVCSSATIPASRIANANKVIEISPTSTSAKVTVDDNGATLPYIFRACFIDPNQGKIGANFATNTLKAKTAFVMYDQSNDYVLGLAQAFEDNFVKNGGKIVGKESYVGATDKDFSAILTKIKSSKADMVYLPDYYNVVNLVTKQAKEKGNKVPFMGGDGWDSSDLDMKAAAPGYYTNHYAPDDPRPEVQNFLKAYAAKYNGKTPDALAVLAYDATNLLLTAIKNAGTDNTDKVRVAMEGISFNGVSGKITYDAQHNPVKDITILAVKAGQSKPVFEQVVSP